MSLLVQIEKQLDGFQLRVNFETNGGVLGLLGASGSGKSMTLRCIAGVETPDRGKIVLDGTTLFDSQQHINLPPQQRRVGLLFQNYALFPNMTVRQNILCALHGERDKRVKEEKLAQVLELLQLRGLENHRPGQLSGGQAQRTALARILVTRPRLLMLDEPFAALDSHLREKLQMELKELLNSFGQDVLLVTHSRDEAYRLCGKIAVLEEGRLVTVKETKALFAQPDSVCAARLTGCKNISRARAVGSHEVEAVDWGVRLHTEAPVGSRITAVGIRAHYFTRTEQENSRPVRFTGRMEEPFGEVFRFRFEDQPENTEPLWWRVSSGDVPEQLPRCLGVAPQDVLLLYEDVQEMEP